MLNGIFPNFLDIFRQIWFLLVHGGWIVVLLLVFRILYLMYMGEIQHQFIHSQSWVFLNIRVPKDNLVSTLAVEAIFGQMHALHSSINFPQKYIEGRDQLWYSLEIVSFGGKISFIIRSPKNQVELVKAAFYSQYPAAEISEVADYMENIHYDPESSEFEMWGTEWKLLQPFPIPIRTYRDFEHPTAEEKIIDPLSGHFEALSKIEPHEFYGVQIIIQPLGDAEWKPIGESLVKQFTGEEEAHESSFVGALASPLHAVARFSYKDTILGGGHGHGHDDENKSKNNWQFMTDAQKERVNLIERKIGKPGYKVKLRHMYIAPKDKFDGTKKGLVIGSYRPLGSAMTNGFKPDVSNTWTSVEYKVSPTLEKPFLDYEIKRRKINLFNGYKNRDIHIGIPMFVFNVEELATIYHFPIATTAAAASMDRTESKKAAPPANLPVIL
jgi:hypothetical protein